MKITIITVVLNNEKTIASTIESVINQTIFEDIEYIIVDGKSSDGTMDIINRYRDKIDRILSEKDNGIYDAMNKGVLLAKGDIIGILNSDDIFYSDNVIEIIKDSFEMSSSDIVYGNIQCVSNKNINTIIRNYRSEPYNKKMFFRGGHPPHPGFFVKKDIYKKYGCFSTEYKVAADYEFMLRVLEKYNVKSIYKDDYFVKMRLGGVSNNSLRSIYKNNIECRQAWIDNGLKPPFGLIFKKPISKFKQLILKERDL